MKSSIWDLGIFETRKYFVPGDRRPSKSTTLFHRTIYRCIRWEKSTYPHFFLIIIIKILSRTSGTLFKFPLFFPPLEPDTSFSFQCHPDVSLGKCLSVTVVEPGRLSRSKFNDDRIARGEISARTASSRSIFRPEFFHNSAHFRNGARPFCTPARTKSYQGHGKPRTMESSIIQHESCSIAALTVRALAAQ